jgi:hypothetical protein
LPHAGVSQLWLGQYQEIRAACFHASDANPVFGSSEKRLERYGSCLLGFNQQFLARK